MVDGGARSGKIERIILDFRLELWFDEGSGNTGRSIGRRSLPFPIALQFRRQLVDQLFQLELVMLNRHD